MRPLRIEKKTLAIIIIACLVFSLTSCSCTKIDTADTYDPSQPEGSPPEEVNLSAWPLTGVALSAGDDLHRSPLSIKIENTPDARPQLGLSHADVVYESVTEGGITRFNCIFQSDIPAEIGPVRSARNSDVSIAPQYQALFFCSGANSTVNREIADAKINDMGYSAAAELYHRVDFRSAPHNLYMYTDQSYVVAERLGLTTKLDTPSSLIFGDAELIGTSAASSIVVPFSESYVATWSYDAAQGVYMRSMDGATLDAEASQQIHADNVVILWAMHEPGVVANGSQTLNIDLTTSGNASIFRDGKRIDGTWEASDTSPPRFTDAAGDQIELSIGKTWFEVVDLAVIVSSS